MDKLGFTFYPKDWWTSETFFEFTPEQRYIYLECLFIMYSNNGYMKTQKTQLENRLRTQINDSVWAIITEKFIYDDNGFTHPSVNKRLRKTIANRENGHKGGRPKKEEEKTQKTQIENPKKPTLEREREREEERETEIENINKNKESTGDESPTLAIKKTIEERKMLFKESLRPFVGKYSNEMLKEFFEYWTETNEQGTKFRKEKEKFFDLSRRLVTWSNREKNKNSTQKLNENGEPIDQVKKFQLRAQQLRDANR